MTEPDVTQIQIGGHRIGIIGLKPVMEAVARELAGRPDEEIKAELMKRLGKSNYIAPAAEAAYQTAFFREYKKSIGEPIPEELSDSLQIKVLGPGCPSCDQLEKDLMTGDRLLRGHGQPGAGHRRQGGRGRARAAEIPAEGMAQSLLKKVTP